MKNSIAGEFNFASLLKFAFPSIVMMIAMGLYGIVDSMFVSRLIGTNALSALNIVYPVITIIIAVGVMLASGGSAIIARKMGDNDEHGARNDFSMLTIIAVIASFVIMIVGIIFIKPIIYALGSSDLIYEYCHDYLFFMLLFAPASILQMLFQMFFVTAGKPTLGMILTIISGITNIILDYVFIYIFGWGVAGAAVATGIGYAVTAISGLIFFFMKKTNMYFIKPRFSMSVLIESCFNGSSEMVTQLSTAVTTFLFNVIMMRFLGENGVAAVTIVLYTQFLMTALFIGFSMGVAPVISYNYGSENFAQLHKIIKICICFIMGTSVLVCAGSILSASGIIQIFSQKGTEVYDLAMAGFLVLPISFLFAGINIFASALFTALSNGRVSAIISFLRTFVFIVAGLVALPMLIGAGGVWWSIPFAEGLTMIMAIIYIIKGKSVYNY